MFWSLIVTWLKVNLFLFLLLGFHWTSSPVSGFNSGKFSATKIIPLPYLHFLFLELLLDMNITTSSFTFHIFSLFSSLSCILGDFPNERSHWIKSLIQFSNSPFSDVQSIAVCIYWSFVFNIFYKLTLLIYNVHGNKMHLFECVICW